MKTFDEKLIAIIKSNIGIGYGSYVLYEDMAKELKVLFESEMLDIIGEDDTVSGHEPLGNIHAISNYRRQQQRVVLNEKLGREDKQPIWDALNNSDA